jgi:hypothetical protein
MVVLTIGTPGGGALPSAGGGCAVLKNSSTCASS